MEGGNLRWDVRDQGGTPAGEDGMIVGPVINDDQWHMVAVTVDGSQNAVMYVDGVSVAEGEEPFWGQIGQLDGISIARNVDSGSAPGGQWFFNGQLDDIQVYDYAMTANEIADEYVAIEGPVCVEAPMYDLNDDCKVDLSDILELAATWLDCNLYPQSACN